MRNRSRWVLLGVSLSAGLWVPALIETPRAGSAENRADPSGADEAKTLRELEQRLSRAVVEGDVATFDELLAAHFTHTNHEGRFRTRNEWMQGRVQGKTNYVSYDVDDLQIRTYGSAAVATGLSKPSWRESDGTLATGRYRFLRVWAKRDGHWRAVAFQSTRILDQKD